MGRAFRRFCFLFLAILIVSVFSFGAFAQTPDTATIQGQVTDQSGAAVPGAKITITNTATQEQRSEQTDASGDFSVSGLPIAGAYDIVAHKDGFADGVASSLTLVGGRTATLDFQLNVTGSQTQVTVTGTVGAVRTDEPQLGIHILSLIHI